MAGKANNFYKVHNDIDDQVAKLSAWVQTLGFVLDGLESEGVKAGKSEAQAMAFAKRYTVFGEMLALAHAGLKECKDTLEQLCEMEFELISAAE